VITALIVACEAGFWVLPAAGLAVRYLLKLRRTSVALLLCEPLLERVLFVVSAIDLGNSAEPSWEDGLAALYIGFTVAYGHDTLRRLDGHAAHRLTGAPRPPKPPRHGLPRARGAAYRPIRVSNGQLIGGIRCTTAFAWTHQGKPYLLSAGHCTTGNGYVDSWSPELTMGDVVYDSWNNDKGSVQIPGKSYYSGDLMTALLQGAGPPTE
jgi:hypothetical protein